MAKKAAAESVEGITSQYPAPRKAQNLDSIKGFKNASGENSEYTKLVARQNAKANDPAFMPTGKRTYAPYERNGAHYGVPVNFQAATSPEAAATQGNGRIFKPAIKRQAPNFQMGTMNSN
jgi:hypothetical protein